MQDIYVLPSSVDSIDELENWMKNFMRLTLRQRILSNDASIEQYGKNNFDRYNEMKAKFLNYNDDEINTIDMVNTISADTITTEAVLEKIDPAFEILHTENRETWETAIIKARNAENLGLVIIIDTDDPLIEFKYYDGDTYDKIEDKWNRWNMLQQDRRLLSDQVAYNIFGLTNTNLYTKIQNYIMIKLERQGQEDYSNTIERDSDEMRKELYSEWSNPVDVYIRESMIKNLVTDTDSPTWAMDEYYNIVTKQVYDQCKHNHEELSKKPTPFFTPDEMLQFGVYSGEVNLYSPKPDNEVIGNTSVVEWFQKYKDKGEINENEWISALKRLYSDYDRIYESDNEEAIAARKQSILELGWNPEIDFNLELAMRAGYRNHYIKDHEFVYEGYIFSKNNLYINFDKFESGKINTCFVTGLSGSGKSTLAEQLASKYKAEWIELDIFEHCGGFNDKQLKDAGDVFYEYLSSHTELWNKLKNKEINGKDLDEEISKFIKYAISWAHRNKNKKYILEGVQIFSFTDPSYMKSQPIVFVNASMVKSILQRFKRNGNGKIEWKEELKNEFPQLLRWYIDNEREFNKFQKAILSEETYEEKNQFILNERVKDVKVDDGGNLHIKTVADVNTEFFKCHRNLMSYEKAGNYESMKEELCKLKYLDNFAVRHMKNKNSKNYKEYADAHARITNDFNKYLKIVTDKEPSFNFTEYYKKSEWYDGDVVVSKGLLDLVLDILGKVLKK